MIILFSVLFFLFPILSMPLILLAFFNEKKIRYKKYYAFLIAVFAGILLFYFIPDSSKDLYRYYIIMNRLSIMSLNNFITYLTSRVEPLSNIYFYVFSKFSSINIIMFATTLISYGLIFYVLFEHQKKEKLANLDFNIITIFALSVFYLVDDITGIRFCLGRLIFFVALYLDMYKNKRSISTLILYTITPLIHSSCLIFVIIRVIITLLKNKYNIKTFLILWFVSLSPTFIIKFANTFSNIPLFSSLGSKAEEYLSLNAGFYPMFILQIIIMFFLFFVLLYTRKHKQDSNTKYINFVLIVLTIGLLFIKSTSISTRFIRAGIIFSLPILMEFIKMLKIKNKCVAYIVIILLSSASLLFQISHLTVKISYGNLFDEGLLKNIFSLLSDN